jgi:16S rRNA processing protein RimM
MGNIRYWRFLTEVFTLAVVGSPFGLKGFIKVRSLSGEIAHLEVLKSINLKQGDSEKIVFIEETMPFGANKSGNSEFLLMKFQGFDNPEAASALNGAKLISDRSQAVPLKKGEFYVEDLKGLAVLALGDSDVLGHITDILEGGNGSLAELRLLSGELKLVPFRNEFFGEISTEEGRIILLEPWILE